MDHVRIDKNLVDPLTKGLIREKIYNTSNKMRLIPIEKRVPHDGNPT